MTQRPSHLPERPNRAADDALSEVLRAVRFTRALYYTVNAATPWPAIRVPEGPALAPGLGPRAQNVLSYHVVTSGSCWTGLERGEPVKLEEGDVILYPRGDAYFLAPELGPRPGDADIARMVGLLQGVSAGVVPAAMEFGPPGGARVQFVCGFLGCDPRPFDPLLSALPRMMLVKRTDERLAHLVKLALAEVNGAPGGDSVRERLSESMFIETVRQHLTTLASDQAGWLAGLRDPVVGRALALLHSGPEKPWTLGSLAKETGASRSALAERFTKLVGQPPMQYLTKWRMQMAAHLLGQTDAKVSAVALEVGYDSEAAFSRAFKKAAGMAPAQWRDARGT
jgi:AraC-like DNA-binding protein